MKCPYCGKNGTSVVETRESNTKVRRRRECGKCERRFTTYEKVVRYDIEVEKRSGETVEFKESKIRSGIERAAEKTEMNEEEIESAAEDVKRQIMDRKTVTTEEIGKLVKKELKKRNEVAYIRFVSVYDSFENAESFQKEVEALQEG